MASIEPACDVALDFKAWRYYRLMAHHAPLNPWCELMLHEWMPLASQGDWRGIRMLFPMEKLFERYVESALARRLPSSVRTTRQAGTCHLCRHVELPAFQLSSDVLLAGQERAWIVDAKWKRISNARGEVNYSVSQGDFYQTDTYGNHYLGGARDIVLVYLRRYAFSAPLAPFHFSDTLRLWVVYFDMEDCTFIEPNPSILPLLPALVGSAGIAAGRPSRTESAEQAVRQDSRRRNRKVGPLVVKTRRYKLLILVGAMTARAPFDAYHGACVETNLTRQ